ncbi:hypothetical protein AMC79_CH02870 [Rhizobium phaseoli]|nr:hypothetical protein AMC89_CH02879 [Rhizobium phaseoli]ANL98648.1 hypothetical protein AMC79_CH02870 [Rhizobium phaseoli]
MASRLRKAGYGLTVAGALAVGSVGGKEGVSTRAYCDIAGVPTICFVETPDVKWATSPRWTNARPCSATRSANSKIWRLSQALPDFLITLDQRS